MNTLPGGRVLVISPHLDDAVFSASALIHLPHAEVWTAFAGVPAEKTVTEWDRRTGFGDGQALMEVRRVEDEVALSGITCRRLPYLERAYTTPQQRVQDLAALTDEVLEWLRANEGATLALPAGAGVQLRAAWYQRLRHRVPAVKPEPARSSNPIPAAQGLGARLKGVLRRVLHWDYTRRRRAAQRRGMLANEDHLDVRDALASAAAQAKVDIVLYEELPYLWSERADLAVENVARRLQRRPEPFSLSPEPVDKYRRMQAYASQLTVMDPVRRRLQDPYSIPSTERYWLLRAE